MLTIEDYSPSFKSDQEWISTSLDFSSDTSSWGHLKDKFGERAEIFDRKQREQTIGSDWANDVAISPGPFIGEFHCTIIWDGVEAMESKVFFQTTESKSTRTWINDRLIDGACKTILRDGDTIYFGTKKRINSTSSS
uniref:FHA domain-containing protein n=1 Tax=Psilocybe cubensis TaxID=181762 RepID=A0A8H8CL67_PSICU